MRQALTIHPRSLCPAVTSIEVEVARPRPGLLALNYVVTGIPRDLHLPVAAAPRRADELWRRTCFEAFVMASPGGGYIEVNLSPSRAWAAYEFGDYRAGMRVAGEIAAPVIERRAADDRFELNVSLDLSPLAVLPSAAVWRLGLAAVIETASGARSYWALAHPPGAADFHAAQSFAYDLAVAAEGS